MSEEKTNQPKQEKDYFVSLDKGMDSVATADMSLMDKLLGKYKNLVVISALIAAGLVLMDYTFLAKMLIMVTLVLVLVHVVTRIQTARNIANKGIDAGVDLGNKGLEKVSSMMKKKEASVPNPVPVEVPAKKE